MRQMILATALLAPFGAGADEVEWSKLSGAEITTALTGKVLAYDNAWQDFRASGRTLYNAGADSWGYWGVRDDRYCSMWPPSDLWACYDLERSGDQLRFVGEAGDITVATYKDATD